MTKSGHLVERAGIKHGKDAQVLLYKANIQSGMANLLCLSAKNSPGDKNFESSFLGMFEAYHLWRWMLTCGENGFSSNLTKN
jgi:hypothetical protein